MPQYPNPPPHCLIPLQFYVDLSLSHASMPWDPRVYAREEKLFPHQISSRVIIQLGLTLPFPLRIFMILVSLWYKWFGKGFGFHR
jgi:hypothetical protein